MTSFITSSPTALLFTFFLLLQGYHVSFADVDCSNHQCGEDGSTIHLPFYLSDNPDNQIANVTDHRLFGLTCKNYTNQTLFKFPNSGDFAVEVIDYVNHRVQFRDPDGCLARRLRDPIALSGTFLSYYKYEELKFVKCLTDLRWETSPYPYVKVGCLSSEGYSVFMGSGDFKVGPLEYVKYGCVDHWTETLPLALPSEGQGWTKGGNFPETFWLSWSDQEFDCILQLPDQNHGRGRYGFLLTKLGLIIFIIGAIPWVICIFCTLCRKAAVSLDRTPVESTFAPSPDQQPHLTTITVTGLDMSEIELAFPKTRVGDTQQLPRVEDNICSICLSEYQTKETLRTITECNHYFHVDCIDEWFKKNATCPLCRNYQVLTKLPAARDDMMNDNA